MRLELLGVGAMRSPRFAPAGLLVSAEGRRIAIDRDAGLSVGSLDAWLLTDDRAELASRIRRRAAELGITACVGHYSHQVLELRPRRVAHTNHPAYAYDIRWRGRRIVWAPEFWRFPRSADTPAPWTSRAPRCACACAVWCSGTSADPPSVRSMPVCGRLTVSSDATALATLSAQGRREGRPLPDSCRGRRLLRSRS